MQLEIEQLKQQIIELQMQILQYQHRDVMSNIAKLVAAVTPVEESKS